MYDYILIDLLNLYFRNYYTHQELIVTYNNTTNVIGGLYGCLISINKLRQKYLNKNGQIIFLVDNPNSRQNYRKELDENYKSNRERQTPQFLWGLDRLQDIILNLDDNYWVCQASFLEADDWVDKVLYNKFFGYEKNSKSLLVTMDKDWASNISETTHWLNKDTIFTKFDYFTHYQYDPQKNKIILDKVFNGDNSDNISVGVPYLPKKTILKLIQNYNSLNEIFADLQNIDYISDKFKQKMLDRKDRLFLNKQLVESINIEFEELKDYVIKCKRNESVLKRYYKSYNFNIQTIDPKLLNKINDDINDSFMQPTRIK